MKGPNGLNAKGKGLVQGLVRVSELLKPGDTPSVVAAKALLDGLPDGMVLDTAELAARLGKHRGSMHVNVCRSAGMSEYGEIVGRRKYWGNVRAIRELRAGLAALANK